MSQNPRLSGVAPTSPPARLICRPLVACAKLCCALLTLGIWLSAQAATVSWVGGSGNWNDSAKWNPNQVPGALDSVVITNDGTYSVTVNVSVTVADLLMGGTTGTQTLAISSATLTINGASTFDTNAVVAFFRGTLSGSGDVTVTGALNWTGGTMSGSGRTIIAASTGVLSISGASAHQLNRVLQNDGTASWTGSGALQMSGGTVNNNGSFTAYSNSELDCYGTGGVNAFNNAGTFTKQGTGLTYFFVNSTGVSFNNSGSVEVQAGTLALEAGGTHSSGFTLASGGTLRLSGTHTFSAVSDITGAGSLSVAGGTVTDAGMVNLSGAATFSSGTATFNGPFGSSVTVSGGSVNFNAAGSLPGLTLSGGTLSGSGDVTISGTFNWTSGTMSGSGRTIIAASTGTLSISGASAHQLNRVLQNDGTASWTGSGALQMSGGTVNNNGSFTAYSNSELDCYGTGGVNAFNNAGTFTKQGTGLTYFFVNSTGVSFNNSGSVEVQAGTLALEAGGTHSSGFTLASGGTLRLSGTHTFSAVSDITGAGSLSVAGGTVTDAGMVNLSGAATFSSGTATFNGPFGSSVTVSGGSVNFNAAGSLPGLTLSGGTLSGSGDVTISGTFNWTSGTMSGSGRTIIAASTGTLSISGASAHQLNRVLQNDGTASWTGSGALQMSGGTVNNNGSFTAYSNSELDCYGTGGVNAFNNAGTFTKQGTGLTYFFVNSTGVSFNNSGSVEVQAGTLALEAGGTHSSGFTLASGGTLRLSGTHTFSAVSDITGAGSLSVAGGTVTDAGMVNLSGAATFSSGTATFNGPFGSSVTVSGGSVNFNAAGSLPGLTLSGGTLSGSGDVTISGTFNWTSGTMSGSGRTIIAASTGTLSISGASAHQLNRVLQNDGTASWTGSGPLQMNGGTLTNNGLFTANSNSELDCYGTGGVNAFNNAGTFTKQGTGLTYFFVNSTGVSFNNSGSVEVQAGTLALEAGGTHSSGFTLASGGTLRLSGTHTFSAVSDITGAGSLSVAGGTVTDAGMVNLSGAATFSSGTATFNGPFGSSVTVSGGSVNFNAAGSLPGLTLSGGTLSGSGDVTISGTFNWTSGTMSGSGRTIIAASTGTLSISGASAHQLNRVLQNDGTASWTGSGPLQMNGGTLTNNGLFTANSNSELDCYGTGGVNAFNNAGTFTKQGTGLTYFFVNSTGVSFNNSGSVDVQAGTLKFDAGFTQTQGQTQLSGGSISANSALQILGGLLGGNGTINASVTSSGVVSPGASPGLLTISGNYTQTTNGALNIELAGTSPGTNYDWLAVTGTATLAGAVNITLANAFYPATNASFTFLTCGSRNGAFTAFNYPSNDVGMQLTYGATSATLQVTNVQTLPSVYWVGGSGDWNNPTNWNNGLLPGPNDDVLINVAGAVTVTYSSGTHSVKSLLSQNAFVLSGGLLIASNTIQVNNTFTMSGGTLRGATVLAGTGGQGITVTGSGGMLDGVTLGSDVSIGNGQTLAIINGLALLGGASITLNSSGSSTYLFANGTQTIGGTGQIVLAGSSSANNLYLGNGSAATLTLGTNVTVRGRGSITQGSASTLLNQGTIQAEVSGQTLSISPNSFTSSGTLNATNGATLNISAGTWSNNGTITATASTLTFGGAWSNNGTITASSSTVNLGGSFTLATLGMFSRMGGVVNLTGILSGGLTLDAATGTWNLSGTINGGTVTASGGAQLVANGGTLSGVSLGSDVSIGNGQTLAIINGLALLGGASITLNSSGSSTYLFANGTQTIGGTGQIVLAGSSSANNLYLGNGSAATLTLGTNVTVRGRGSITQGSASTLLNQGTIQAEVSGQTLSISPNSFTNSGTLNATNGATLNISAGTWSNNGTITATASTLTFGGAWSNNGTITASSSTVNLGGSFTLATLGMFSRMGGVVNLTGILSGGLTLDAATGTWNLSGTINGGTVTASGGAQLVANGGTLSGVSLGSDVSIGNGQTLAIINGLTLLGGASITLNSSGSSTYLFANGTQTIGGTGQIVLAGSSSANNLYLGNGSAATLTLGTNVTVRGRGSITQGSASTLLNQGTIQADVSGQTLSISLNSFTSSGTLGATNGATLNISAGTWSNNGTITATASTLTFGGAWSNNGTITASSSTVNLGGSFTLATLGMFSRMGGVVNLTGILSGGLTLDAATGTWNLSGTINGGTVTASGGAQLVANGGTLSGVSLGSDVSIGNGQTLAIINGLALLGGASITLNSSGSSTYLFANGTQTIGGTGQIVLAGSSSANNLYLGNGSAATLTLGTNVTVRGRGSITQGSASTLLNQGTIQADVSGQTLSISLNSFTSSGTLGAESGTLNVAGAFTQAGGTLSLGITSRTVYGRINFSSQLGMTGTLDAHLNPPYLPSVGDTFTLLTYPSRTGNFGTFALDPAAQWQATNGTTAFTITAAAVCDLPSSGLLAWWKGEGNAFDNAGANDGTPIGSAMFGSGEVGQAFNLNGTNGYILVPDSPALNPSNAITVEAWIYMHHYRVYPEANNIVVKDNFNTTKRDYLLQVCCAGIGDAAGFTVFSGTNRGEVEGGSLSLNAWHHLAGTYDGSRVKVYVDGHLAGDAAYQLGPGQLLNDTDTPLLIGGNNDSAANRLFDGLIDEVGLYSRALSSNEVVAIYNAGSAGKCINSLAPSIISTPQSQSIAVGSNAVFTVAATGTQPLSYQWVFNGTNLSDNGRISGSQSNLLTLATVVTSDSGAYQVVVVNPYGTTTSAVATLTVGYPPAIVVQPESQTVPAGSNVTFAVLATGTVPLKYQWLFAGSTIANATNSSYGIIGVRANNAGNYSVSVSNAFGTVASSNAILQIILPDLAISRIAAPIAATIGSSVQLSFTITNASIATAAGPWLNQFLLAANAGGGGAQSLGTTSFTSSIPPGGSTTVTQTVTLPANVSGARFIGVFVDSANNLAESNETNNTTFAPIGTLITAPDLAITAISAPTSGLAGQAVSLSFTFTNIGNASAIGPWSNQILLATGTNGQGAQSLGTFNLTNALAPGDSTTVTQLVILPATTIGTQYFGVFIDSGNNVLESDEDNNTSFLTTPIVVTAPDLIVEQVLAPGNAQFGQSITVSWVVRNVGSSPTTATWSDYLYLSSDTSLGGDRILFIRSAGDVAPLAPGASYTRTQSVALPLDASLSPGNYYILAVADFSNAQVESNETNNSAAGGPIQLTLPPLPDLVVEAITAPSAAFAEQTTTVNWRVRNVGASAATNSWVDRVYISTDDQVGNDTLLGIFAHTNSLAPGEFYEQTKPVKLPTTPGQYWIVITTDAHSQVDEHSGEFNNSLVATQPIQIATYVVSVETDVNVAPAGTPIPIRVVSSNAATSELVGNVPVTVRVGHVGTRRVIPLVTDTNGQAQTVFQPLPGEAGRYELAADRPSVSTDVTQDQFTLVGMRLASERLSHTMVVGNTVTNQVELRNLSDVSLSGITAVLQNAPANVAVQVTTPPSLASLGTNLVTYTLRANDDSVLASSPRVLLSSAERASTELTLDVQVLRLAPQLVANPGTLAAAMLRGGQTLVQCEIANLGGAPSGESDVLLPVAPWLSLVTTQRIASLGPGEKSTVILALTPAQDLPLGPYTGTIVLASQSSSLTIPFRFTAVSDSTGKLRVTVVDEFTYYAEGSPNVTNATVALTDPVTGSNVVSGITDQSGEVLLTNVIEAYYNIEVRAGGHGEYRSAVVISADQTNNLTAFLPRQLVTYNWIVIPTEIPDHYLFTLETVFETHVPAPVVTISPALVNLDSLVDPTNQVLFAITNHGLIAVQGLKLQFDANPLFEITPLTGEIPELPAQSTVLLPVVFRRLDGLSPSSPADYRQKSSPAQSSGSTIGCLFVGGALLYHFLCGPEDRFYNIPIVLQRAVSELCTGGPTGRPNPPSGGPGGGTSPGQPYVVPFDYTARPFTLDCGKIGWALLKCGISAVPGAEELKCPFYIWRTWSDVLHGCFQDRQSWLSCAKTTGKGSFSIVINCGKALGLIEIEGGTAGLYNVYKFLACLDGVIDALNSGTTSITPDPNVVFLLEQTERLKAKADALAYSFGDPIWLSGEPNEEGVFLALVQVVDSTTDEASDQGARISSSERAQLLALPRPSQLNTSHVTAFVDRWNRSLDYWAADIFNETEVPPGQNADFIAMDRLQAKWDAAKAAADANLLQGFDDIFDGIAEAILRLQQQEQAGVCTKVRLKIDQEAVLARAAFAGTLEINNNSGAMLTGISVSLDIRDAGGQSTSNLFAVRGPEFSGLSSVDGSGVLGSGATGRASWTFIPAADAATNGPTQYLIGGTLSYVESGQQVTVPLFPESIQVLPDPSLRVKYFHQRDVYSDDPFTPGVEPTEPFVLGLMMSNVGRGTARNVTITSAQPRIIENEKGLLIDFKIIGTQVGTQQVSPSLTVNLGSIEPGMTAVASWLLTSSLQGRFIDYQATYEHLDALGDLKLSLIDSVEIHELIHSVRADVPSDDGLPDFLANDLPDVQALPDTLYLSSGGIVPVSAVTNASVSGPPDTNNLQTQISASLPSGWAYLRIADPALGNYQLVRVLRSDGRELRLDENAWTTHRTIRPEGQPSHHEDLVHLFDYNSTGSYTLTYAVIRPTPVLTWTNAAAIAYGTALSSTQLNATASVPGSFVYSPPAGAVLPADTYTLSVLFTPNDTNHFSNAAGSVALVVVPAPLTVTASNATRHYGATNPIFGGIIAGLQNADNITASYATPATVGSSVGTYPIRPGLVDPANRLSNYTVTTNNGALSITRAVLTVTPASVSRPYGQPNPTFTGTMTGLQNGDNITATYNCDATPTSPPGPYTILPTLLDPDNRQTNYISILSKGILTVTSQPMFLAVTRTNGNVTLSWATTPGRAYEVQFKTNLGQANWTSLASAITATNSTAATSDSIGPDTQRFYRVVLLP